MLQTYQAQIHGSQLIWIDPPPAPLAHARVLIVVERAEPAAASALMPSVAQNAHSVFMASEGCLGRGTRQDVDAQLAAQRDEWHCSPNR